MKTRVKVAVLTVALVGTGLLVAWNVNWGRPRANATVKLVNQSAKVVDYVTFYIDDAKGDKVNQYLHELESGQAIRVAIPTSEFTVRQITCEHPDFNYVLSFDDHIKIVAGHVFVVTIAQDGSMAGKFEQ
jgi:hypothetical protein